MKWTSDVNEGVRAGDYFIRRCFWADGMQRWRAWHQVEAFGGTFGSIADAKRACEVHRRADTKNQQAVVRAMGEV